ncbi:helix-turn-helix transcriptional regulator [Vibrio sp. 10N.261.46.E12]|uniref:helix-turn-helix transcriptional regulator n=1 Tax=unclassified Vibrio TaxID=2614977 RepID=UPI000977ACD0|nr:MULTISPECIES: helix-turn-helix transcriptional regulator [unclassified Vibrio]OMO38439.1 hypothetical protein BH584_17715 [Vibrio sp. 10N.261.45.E1]PMJ36225.1 hypothetical protein BCU27_23575 [Vibrio sp. 10N.286.45.B6]PML84181.1 hypothetical protein BCT66_17910 [Vibrio sp. 10N.261.49.E11]PMM89296.1 hypothetical protein BCT46_25195 [Vibrio sp. 10N.261.46.E8]PMN44183.1 hypothetical protein BCT32_15710 [Vibrio sp. 10N.261.45.E11]
MARTPLGKALAKARIDLDESLADMAAKLSISVAQLSAVELGNRTLRPNVETALVEQYSETIPNMDKLIRLNRSSIKLSLIGHSTERRSVALTLANKFSTLSDEQCRLVQAVIK